MGGEMRTGKESIMKKSLGRASAPAGLLLRFESPAIIARTAPHIGGSLPGWAALFARRWVRIEPLLHRLTPLYLLPEFLMMRLRTLCAMAAAIVAMLGLSTDVHASVLGVAGEFNGFVFGNLSSAGADTEGRLAVGGNFSATNYGVGDKLTNSNGARNDLVVGGNLNAPGAWQVFNGNAVWGTSLTAAPTTPHGTTFQGTPVNFAAAKAELIALSEYWGTLATNATVYFDTYSTLTLTATNPGLNVFNVTEAIWEATSNKQIVNPFPNATLLINVAGVNVTQSGGLSYNGSGSPSNAHSKVLFNYSDALTLDNNNIAMLGSVLAPYANLTINGGGINGNGIANNVLQKNGGEFHYYSFTGDLPTPSPDPEPTSTPEPSSAVIGVALCAMGTFAARRRLFA